MNRSLLLFLLFLVKNKTAMPANEIIGDMNIKCINDRIEVNFSTKNPFKGRVFIQGADDPACSQDFTRNQYRDAAVSIPFATCKTNTKTTLGGFMQSALVIISFHPIFMTKDDMALMVDCVQPESSKNVTQRLQVGTEMTTKKYRVEQTSPDVWYSLHLEDKYGSQIYYANLGDTVVHKWETTAQDYGILVHSCKALAEGMSPVQILDETGCSLDESLFPELVYSPDVKQATATTAAFKFQSSQDLSFQCKVDFCITARDQCQMKTPPNCKSTVTRRNRRSNGPLTKTVTSPKLIVADTSNSTNYYKLIDEDYEYSCINGKTLILILTPGIILITCSFVLILLLAARIIRMGNQTTNKIMKTDFMWNTSEC